MSRLARRKQKIEYEDDPVVAPPKAPERDEEAMPEVHITRGGVAQDQPTEVVGPRTARHQGITELMERAARIAEHNPKPEVIGMRSIPADTPPPSSEPTKPTSSKTEVENKPTSPADVSVHGYGNVFGGKEKKVKHT